MFSNFTVCGHRRNLQIFTFSCNVQKIKKTGTLFIGKSPKNKKIMKINHFWIFKNGHGSVDFFGHRPTSNCRERG